MNIQSLNKTLWAKSNWLWKRKKRTRARKRKGVSYYKSVQKCERALFWSFPENAHTRLLPGKDRIFIINVIFSVSIIPNNVPPKASLDPTWYFLKYVQKLNWLTFKWPKQITNKCTLKETVHPFTHPHVIPPLYMTYLLSSNTKRDIQAAHPYNKKMETTEV